MRNRFFWRQLQKGDLEYFVLNGRNLDSERDHKHLLKMYTQAARNISAHVLTNTKDERIMMFGLAPYTPGVADIWSITTPLVSKYPKSTTKLAKKALDIGMRQHQYHRVQAYVLLQQDGWIRWLESLGFKCEGVMEKFTADKQNVLRMAIVK